jgi:flagellar motor switch protein FliN/FliY
MSDASINNGISNENLAAQIQANLQTQAGSQPMESAANSAAKSLGFDTSKADIDMFMDIVLQVKVELGQTRMTLREILDLKTGSVIELNRLAGESVDILINERKIAKGEVVVVDDKFGVRITELLNSGKIR